MERDLSRADFIRKLEHAADNIADVPRIELQVLLRRAALRLRNMPLQPDENFNLDEAMQRLADDLENNP